jgi:hypothetical protein
MATPAKKFGMFSSLETRDQALKMTRDAAYGFLFVAALHALLGFFFMPAVLVDAVILAVLAFFLLRTQSRVAAVLLLLVSSGQAAVTVLNRLGMTQLGGKNIILAVIMLIVAVRAVEATFKLQGRFTQPPRRIPTRAAA